MNTLAIVIPDSNWFYLDSLFSDKYYYREIINLKKGTKVSPITYLRYAAVSSVTRDNPEDIRYTPNGCVKFLKFSEVVMGDAGVYKSGMLPTMQDNCGTHYIFCIDMDDGALFEYAIRGAITSTVTDLTYTSSKIDKKSFISLEGLYNGHTGEELENIFSNNVYLTTQASLVTKKDWLT